jgi:hypothetical protein
MISIREESGSNHRWGSALSTELIRGFPQPIRLDSSKYIKFGQGRFLPRPFQLVIH